MFKKLSPDQSVKLQLKLNYKILSIVLFLVILGMLWFWKPWQNANKDRTVYVAGEAIIKAEPLLFVFNPTFSFDTADSAEGNAKISAKSKEVLAGLKKAGVEDKDIKTTSDSYDDYKYDSSETIKKYNLNFTVTVASKAVAQKVQDFLLTAGATGQLSPQGQFTQEQRQELENKARDIAAKNAKEKASKQAELLGFRLGDVKTVDDGGGFDDPVVYDEYSSASSPSVQPGENELTYTVYVTYFVR